MNAIYYRWAQWLVSQVTYHMLLVLAADGLYKRDVFRLPDPFAVATLNGEQTKTTQVCKRTLNPYWNENFDLYAL
jgi:E3 ubiquitin-protein ligase NEDD4